MEPSLSKREASLIESLRTRHGRRDSEFSLCDGLRACSEVVSLRPDLLELVVVRDDFPLDSIALPRPPVILSGAEFDRLARTVHSQGILTVSRRPAPPAEDAPLRDPFALVLDRVRDPGNFGTILRTARAVGLHDVFLTKGSADAYSDKAVRSASGAQYALDIRTGGDLGEVAAHLRSLGIKNFWRTVPANGKNLFQTEGIFDRGAIVLGCESTGVAELEQSGELTIPMPGTAESLNVAQAATVILFEYVRRIVT